MNNDFFYLAGKKFSSRLILGSGKFPDNKIFKKVIEQTQTEMITVALRRVDVKKAETDDILKNIDRKKITVLLNTSGAKEASQAVKIARIGRESGLTDWIKIEVINDMKYLMPDPVETLKACEILVKEGFKVMPYIGNDPVLCRKLEDAGCICVMPLGSPIGSGRGIDNSYNLDIIVENSKIPVIVDAGIGKPSHAASVMEIGVDAVMLNTAISCSSDPVKISGSFKKAIEAGREAFKAGMIGQCLTANASSPLENILESL